MTVEGQILVVGADSTIGSALVVFLKQKAMRVIGTTRRKVNINSNYFFLDLADSCTFEHFNARYAYVFFCAGISNMVACENELERTYLVNVANTLRLAKKLHFGGAHIVFLSSNAVFDGRSPKPSESSRYSALTEYGRQKAFVEQELMSFSEGLGLVSIVRLSKVLLPTSGVVADFIEKLENGYPCFPFDDLLISPISLKYTLDGLVKIALYGGPGVFHLSGFEEISYAEFTRKLAVHIGANPALVRYTTSIDLGGRVLFKPQHPALGMERTNELLGIKPEPCQHLLDELFVRKS